MKVTFLGVGSAFSRKHYNNNCLIDFDKARLLIDCGHTAGRSLSELDYDWLEIGSILVTHMHADHIGGLEECALVNLFGINRFGGFERHRNKPNILGIGTTLVTLKNWLSVTTRYTTQGRISPDEYFHFTRLDYGYPFQFEESVVLVPYYVPHIKLKGYPPLDSLAIGIHSASDPKVLFVSDTFEPMDIDLYKEYDIIFQGCEFGEWSGAHTCFEQLKKLPEGIRERMYLMHYGDNFVKFEDEVRDHHFHLVQQHQKILL
jgi:hypothetical protein